MKERIQKFFEGRYGTDQLSLALVILSLILTILGQILDFGFLVILSYIPLGFTIYRTFSKDIRKRSMENYRFSIFMSPVYKRYNTLKRRFKERKTHKFFKCPSCKTVNRVPKNIGRIKIICPKCKTEFERRT